MTEIEELNRECKRLHEQAAPQVQAPKTSGEDRLRDELRRFAEQKKQICLPKASSFLNTFTSGVVF